MQEKKETWFEGQTDRKTGCCQHQSQQQQQGNYRLWLKSVSFLPFTTHFAWWKDLRVPDTLTAEKKGEHIKVDRWTLSKTNTKVNQDAVRSNKVLFCAPPSEIFILNAQCFIFCRSCYEIKKVWFSHSAMVGMVVDTHMLSYNMRHLSLYQIKIKIFAVIYKQLVLHMPLPNGHL